MLPRVKSTKDKYWECMIDVACMATIFWASMKSMRGLKGHGGELRAQKRSSVQRASEIIVLVDAATWQSSDSGIECSKWEIEFGNEVGRVELSFRSFISEDLFEQFCFQISEILESETLNESNISEARNSEFQNFKFSEIMSFRVLRLWCLEFGDSGF
ncbi:hypothetical protein KI387_007523 [Taxus chinensis]|uniref:Uncharacterized protein n=1 Tax=Taxus chinensis TaxID=29808 RepID=A0AA38GVA4_TAXCH|nr:hypothetical protein KI387_007523 [Taxus chinensis]